MSSVYITTMKPKPLSGYCVMFVLPDLSIFVSSAIPKVTKSHTLHAYTYHFDQLLVVAFLVMACYIIVYMTPLTHNGK